MVYPVFNNWIVVIFAFIDYKCRTFFLYDDEINKYNSIMIIKFYFQKYLFYFYKCILSITNFSLQQLCCVSISCCQMRFE